MFSKCSTVNIYSPDGILIGRTKNPLILDDIRRQIKQKGLEGYYLEWNDNYSIIDKDGRSKEYPDCYKVMEKIWIDLVGF